jgi:hypothetical protein
MSDITSLDTLIASAKQRVTMIKTSSRTSVAVSPFSVFDIAGAPGAGVLGGTSTSTGVVPTDATAGCPVINAFGGSATGRLLNVEFACPVACRLAIFDLLWKGGAYAFNASTTGQSPTSFSSRVPVGTDFTGCELWYEQVTAGTLVQNVAVTYNDQGGATSTTGTVAAPAAMIVGRMMPLPLAAGDSGVRGVTGVVGTVASGGTFNILVMRKLWEGRVPVAGGGDLHDYLRTGMPQVFADSALFLVAIPDSTATSLPEVRLTIGNG